MDIYGAQRLIGEDAVNTMHERYNILRFLSENDHAGRRVICEHLSLTERTVRNHLGYLSQKKLIKVSRSGVSLLNDGKVVAGVLGDFFSRVFSTREKETALADYLGINGAVIVHGDSSADESVLTNIAYEADRILTDQDPGSKVIAVSGGRTMREVSKNLRSVIFPQCTMIPVRGAVGASHSFGANSICSAIGMKFRCNAYRLNIPDNIGISDLGEYSLTPDVVAVTEMYDKIDILMFGAGNPSEVIPYRTFGELEKGLVSSDSCVSEALGFYLDRSGRVIKLPEAIGLTKDQLSRIPKKYVVAGGSGKSDAIKALCAFMNDVTLITDEGCADALLNK